MAYALPLWHERERPTTYVIDVHESNRDYSILPPSDGGENDDFIEWVNDFKVPLHAQLRTVHPLTIGRLGRRGITLDEINAAVGHITNQPLYPIERCVTDIDAASLSAYGAAAQMNFFPKEMSTKDAVAKGQFANPEGQFIHLMDFLHFREQHIEQAPKDEVITTIAHELGHAMLARPLTSVVIPRLPDRPSSPYSWSGYLWRYNEKYWGYLLDEANAAKIAAVTRQVMGLSAPEGPTTHPIVRNYGEIYYGEMGAIILDVINLAAGHHDSLAVYRPIWEFVSTQDEGARDEVASIVGRATKSSVRLEELEAVPIGRSNDVLPVLKRVEEACDLDVSWRPSRFLDFD